MHLQTAPTKDEDAEDDDEQEGNPVDALGKPGLGLTHRLIS